MPLTLAPAAEHPCPDCDTFPYPTAAELADHRNSCTGAVRPTGSGRFETVPNGFGGTTTRRRTTVTPPTDRQVGYLRTLLAERAGVDAAEEIRATLNSHRSAGTLSKAEVSRAIDGLLAIGRPRSSAPAREFDTPEVAEGRYALDTPDGLRFYVVDHGKGRWEGRTFVSAQASDDLHPVRNAAVRRTILAAIAEDPKGAMIRYGQEIGACGHCGRTLTDAASRARGIGPVCADKL